MKRINPLTHRPLVGLGAITLAASLLWACGSDPTPPPDTAADLAGTAKSATDKPTATADPNANNKDAQAGPSGVNIDKRIVELCALQMPRFDFDSASVSPEAAKALDSLADCFVNGKAKGMGMRLVGHADERGETMYNFGLGQRRAGSVTTYLQKKGVAQDKLESSSRGELDATGTDDDGWARDRRVDILLAE
jgi:peptidoglycan-associated lipoprotein